MSAPPTGATRDPDAAAGDPRALRVFAAVHVVAAPLSTAALWWAAPILYPAGLPGWCSGGDAEHPHPPVCEPGVPGWFLLAVVVLGTAVIWGCSAVAVVRAVRVSVAGLSSRPATTKLDEGD